VHVINDIREKYPQYETVVADSRFRFIVLVPFDYVFTARRYAERDIATASRLSACPLVRPSITLR